MKLSEDGFCKIGMKPSDHVTVWTLKFDREEMKQVFAGIQAKKAAEPQVGGLRLDLFDLPETPAESPMVSLIGPTGVAVTVPRSSMNAMLAAGFAVI